MGRGTRGNSRLPDMDSPLIDHNVMRVVFEAVDSGGRLTWNQPKPSWRSVPNNTDLQEPGWTPRTLQNRPRQPVTVSPPHQPSQHPTPHHRQYPHQPMIRHVEETPAWYGSLRSATDPKASDRKVIDSFHLCSLL